MQTDPADCVFNWPEGCDLDIPRTYKQNGIECWAWSYNYPGNEMNQADALYNAAYVGYDGYVLDIEKEFDSKTTELENLLKEFMNAKADAIANGFISNTWPVYVTTWGNPKDHKMHVEIIDKYADGHMPQTYLEVWGESYMNEPAKWVKTGTCEYRELGAKKPIHHIVSTEYNKITSEQINTFFRWSGRESSVWRVPGTETPLSIWQTWEKVDWEMSDFEVITCP